MAGEKRWNFVENELVSSAPHLAEDVLSCYLKRIRDASRPSNVESHLFGYWRLEEVEHHEIVLCRIEVVPGSDQESCDRTALEVDSTQREHM
jgi:hypothetical protein